MARPGGRLLAGMLSAAAGESDDADLSSRSAIIESDGAIERFPGPDPLFQKLQQPISVLGPRGRLRRNGTNPGAHPRDAVSHTRVPRGHCDAALSGRGVDGGDGKGVKDEIVTPGGRLLSTEPGGNQKQEDNGHAHRNLPETADGSTRDQVEQRWADRNQLFGTGMAELEPVSLYAG